MSDIWFDGPIAEAISLVAEKQCVFLVYIHDESDETNTLNDTLKDEQVTKAIRESTVAVAMERNSENAALFGQYYPIQTVPILYFIKQGTIRDFGTETLSSQEIIDKINTVNQISTVPVSASAPAAPATPVPASQPPTNDTTHIADTVRRTEQNDETNSKKAELQKQLEQVRKERAEREKQDAKDREIKRRQEAKMLQEAQQSRVDKENKIYFEKIKKERQEDEAHRKRVREQIARDRAEKIAQRNAEKKRQNSTSSTTLPTEESTSSSSLSNNSHHAYSNLNIRQLDGSNIRHQFEAVSTLSEVRHWIQENRTEDAKKPYKLSSQFPTRLFTDADDNTTLKDLNLCPSATIIMKPLKAGFSSARSVISGGNGGVTGYIYSGFDLVYGFVIALINLLTGILATLFPTNGMSHTDMPASQHQEPLIRNMRGGQRLGGEGVSAESSSTATSSAAQKRNPYATKVNTLHDEDDSEDEDKRSTYNGNSVNHE
ncbi:UBX domain-containing protein 4-like isoform X2 [Mucor ambiguus]|uniref:UBX domain-containing protein 2 n=1 Tax=Mucor ambiguus TaxID=91626 RepID=A0A0C9MJ28_9FUNG|nr:UBX domain-containing protein 4-like isoform X2 [Mucor ambiguus]